MELTEFLACTSLTDTKYGPQLWTFLCSKQPVPWGGRHLSGRVLPGPLEQNELWQLLGIWEGAAPGWHQLAMDTDLLASSPALLHYHCELNTNV